MARNRLTYKPMLVVFTGAMALSAIALNAVTWARVKSSINEVVEVRAERELWEDLLSTIKDAETGQRGFLITGESSYLAPFEAANLRLGENLAALKERARDDPFYLAEIASVEVTALRRFDLMKEARVVREREGFEAAQAIVASGEGMKLMDQLRLEIGRQLVRLQRAASAKTAQMHDDLSWGYAAALGTGLVALGSGMVAFLLLRDALKHARREQRLAEEKRRAESADREKSAFLATMSHEIRTPMNAILGFAELLRDRLEGERELGYVDSILSGGRSLLQLINDILDLSKVEAGMLELHPEPTDLHATAHFVRQLFHQLAAQRGIELRTEVDEAIPRSLLLDSLRLRQILINVVGNAVKFTEEGHVALRFLGQPDPSDLSRIRVFVEVEDTGCGIPEDRLESIFRPFVQAGGTGEDAAGIPGTGLGLAIVNRLTKLMGGAVTVESEAGRGSVFRFDFPGVEVSSRLPESSLAQEEETVDFDDLRPSTLLVADDNATNLELVAEIFEDTRHRLLFASDGDEAVAIAKREKPDLVLIDVRMPKMDGFQALDEIRAEEDLRLLPVIAVTASSLGNKDDQARRRFDGYLRKPFSRAQLHAEIAQFIPAAESGGGDPDAPSPDLPLTPERATRWRQLAATLEELGQEEMPALLGSMSVPEIERFAQRLKEQAENADCEPLALYAAALEFDATSFSPGQMETTLKRFSEVVEAIRTASTP